MNISLSFKKQSGYSIVEWMVAISLSLFLSAGILTVFVSTQRATNETLVSGELLDNSSVAMQLISKDLRQAYFFAQMTGENEDHWNLNGVLIETGKDCLDNLAGSFPVSGKFQPFWGATISTAGAATMGCLDDADSSTGLVADSDYISIKRAKGLHQSSSYTGNKFYLDINPSSITVYGGSASELSSVAQAWEYIHHVYYLDTENNVNRLRRLTLETSGMVREEVLAEGVEMMRFMFVLDHLLLSDRDGAVHSVVGASDVTDNDWSTGRVIGVKVFLLIKSLVKKPGYSNTDTYQLGDYTFTSPGDNYKRKIVSKIIMFPNSVVLVNG
jgi:type IV pilus assembly protein PilW